MIIKQGRVAMGYTNSNTEGKPATDRKGTLTDQSFGQRPSGSKSVRRHLQEDITFVTEISEFRKKSREVQVRQQLMLLCGYQENLETDDISTGFSGWPIFRSNGMPLSAAEDFKRRSLGALPTLLERLAYICSLHADGSYAHWGL